MSEQWTAPEAHRPSPGPLTAERDALEEWLDFHRATLLRKCAGLTADQLRLRPVPSSQLSLLGLVRHLTEVERAWFRMRGNGEQLDWPHDPDQDGADFRELDSADAAADLATYRDEVAAARVAMVGHGLDEERPNPEHPERVRNVRWIYLHMIEEYARHNGHADLLRELIDGTTGE